MPRLSARPWLDRLVPDAPSTEPARDRPLAGMALMLASAFGFAMMHGLVRHVSADVHPIEVSFFRNLFGLLVLAPWVARKGTGQLATRRFGLHLARASCNVVAMLMFFTALTLSPLAQVQALGFTAPLFTTVLAVFLLGEKVGVRRTAAVVVGFTGALIIVRPGLREVDLGSMLTLGSAAVWAFTMIIIKKLSRTDSAFTITAWMVLLMTPMSLVAALFVWTWPTPEQLLWMIAIGIIGTVGQMLITQAFRIADTTVVLPFDFTKIVWGAGIGYVFFGELIDGWTWLGAGVIFAGAFYLAWRERQIQQQRALERSTA